MISIIVPVYNAEKYLEECLASIARQAFLDFECILIDDGSEDKSGSICDTWSLKDKRFHVVHQENSGVSSARNKGIEIAKGEYIAFVDSDDWLESDYLQTLYNRIDSDKSDLSILGICRDFPQGNSKRYSYKSCSFPLDCEHVEEFVGLVDSLILYSPYVKLYCKDIIRNNSISFDESVSYGEDLLFNFQYLRHVRNITCSDAVLYHYRCYESNTLSTKIDVNRFSIDYSQWQVLCTFFKEKNLWVEHSKSSLYRRLWGFIYDALFAFPNQSNVGKEYIEKILSIPEIDDLNDYQDVFACSSWIKKAILNRRVWLMYLYFKILK